LSTAETACSRSESNTVVLFAQALPVVALNWLLGFKKRSADRYAVGSA